MLVVPTNSFVTALSARTGAPLWTFPVPAPTAPVLSAGNVCVGSSNHDVYSLSESSGTQLWSFATRPHQRSWRDQLIPDHESHNLADRIGGRNLYALDASTGAVSYRFQLNAGTSGVRRG